MDHVSAHRIVLFVVVLVAQTTFAQTPRPPECEILRVNCAVGMPAVEATMVRPCASNAQQYEGQRKSNSKLPTIEACLGADRFQRLQAQLKQQQQGVDQARAAQDRDRAAAARPNREGVTIFGFELGTAPNLPGCVVFAAPAGACVVVRSAPGNKASTLELSFGENDVPGFIDRRGGLPRFDDAHIGVAEGTMESIEFHARYDMLSTVIASLDKKFGPHVEKTVPMHNDVGATWDGEEYTWRKGEAYATIVCREFMKVSCAASVSTQTWRDFLAQLKTNEANRGKAL
jgi:hypothetical protein